MKDKNHYAENKANYGIIYDGNLPENVRDELIDRCPGNDCGIIYNPEYHPKFKQWLIDNDMPVECYIVWFSW